MELNEIESLIDVYLSKNKGLNDQYEKIKYNDELKAIFEEETKQYWQLCAIVAIYSGTDCWRLNSYLRGIPMPNSTDRLNAFSKLLSYTLVQLHSCNDCTLYRNELVVKEQRQAVYDWYRERIGKFVYQPGFLSTSYSEQDHENRVMFKIHSKSDRSNAKDIRPIIEQYQPARNKREQEILYNKCTTFRIDAVENNFIILKEAKNETSEATIELSASYWDIPEMLS